MDKYLNAKTCCFYPSTDAPAKPTLSQSPASPILGDTVTLTCTGSGTHRWFKDGVLISGETSQTYVISAVALSDIAQYSCDNTNAQSVRSLVSDGLNVRPKCEYRVSGISNSRLDFQF